MTFLLDINVLIALCDPQHVHHSAAHEWFGRKGKKSWATCPITENGFVRILCNPSYPNRLEDAGAALHLLRMLCSSPGHTFLEDTFSIRLWTHAESLSHKNITDLYLLDLAKKSKANLVTLDRQIPADFITDGKRYLEIIAAGDEVS